MPYSDGWKVAASVPFSNEIPCGTGSPTLDHQADGVFLEAFRRIGMNSYGVNSFFGRDGRHYFGALAQQKLGPSIYLEGGLADITWSLGETHVYSASASWSPGWDKAIAFRVDDQDGFFKYIPTISWLLGGQKSALRLTVESTLIRNIGPTTVVAASLKF